jgi:glutamine amidotransferase
MSNDIVVIIDYGMGNVNSIANMIKKVGGKSTITSDINQIGDAAKLILPGVGAFDNGMKNLKEMGLIPILNKKVEEQAPILGICLGMQLLTKSSEEGQSPGLGWIDAETHRFNFEQNDSQLKIPHMGWNMVIPQDQVDLFRDFEDFPRFYFVHSYHVVCKNKKEVLGVTTHGYGFTCSVRKDNIFGTQFHPEKSHRFGMQLMKNYLYLV